jgi:hypothetical protein
MNFLNIHPFIHPSIIVGILILEVWPHPKKTLRKKLCFVKCDSITLKEFEAHLYITMFYSHTKCNLAKQVITNTLALPINKDSSVIFWGNIYGLCPKVVIIGVFFQKHSWKELSGYCVLELATQVVTINQMPWLSFDWLYRK